jgi:hypothetical protein
MQIGGYAHFNAHRAIYFRQTPPAEPPAPG